MGFLPSKNFIVTVGAAIIVIFAGYFASFVWKTGHNTQIAAQKTVRSEQKFADNTNTDTDADGLMDWEEILWKTDVNEADTDGDGVSDSEEIAKGRDPTIKRGLLSSGLWSDSLKKPEELVADKNGATMTEQLAKNFAANYFGAKGLAAGDPLNTPTKNSLANSLLMDVEKGVKSYSDIYTAKDIYISPSNDAKKYLNELGNAFDEIFKDIPADIEVKIAASAALAGDFTRLNKLDNNLSAYKKLIEFLKKEPVPAAYVPLHLLLLNTMNNTAIAVENVKQIEKDPVRATIGVQLYYTEIGRARQFLRDLKTQTENDRITFSLGEGGAFFNQYFEQI